MKGKSRNWESRKLKSDRKTDLGCRAVAGLGRFGGCLTTGNGFRGHHESVNGLLNSIL